MARGASDAAPFPPFLCIANASWGIQLLLEIIKFLHNDGFPVPHFTPDSKIHRFEIEKGDRNAGYYIAHRNFLQRTGEEYYFVIYGSWRTGETREFNSLKGHMTPEEKKIWHKQLQKDKKLIEKVKAEGHETAANEAEQKWNSLSEEGESDYLNRKQVSSSNLGIRFDNFLGDIYVPARDINGRLWSFQKIARDGEKRFHSGGRIQGCSHIIGNVGSTIYIAEGFATACSIQEATGEAVAVTFYAGNIAAAAREIRSLYIDKTIIICGDDDRFSEINIGREKAEEAARKIQSIALFPKFKSEEKLTDWNDLHVTEGIEEVRRQLERRPELPALIENFSAGDMESPFPDENERTFTRKATIANVVELLRRLNITVRYNIISKEEEILIPQKSFTIDNQANASFAHITSWCNRARIPTGPLADYMSAIADSNPYNPVATWIESKPWDGRSRLQDLYDTIKSTDEKLKENLIRKWLISCVAAAYEPNGVKSEGMLVLCGKQALGKTSWFNALVPRDLRLTSNGKFLKSDDRDSVFQAICFWIVELGELDATFRKSDLAQLKSFISRNTDVLRRSHARKESHYARRTIFFGSVNESDFLQDPTGNRRYWTVECTEINFCHNIDMQQLWAEVLTLYKGGEHWSLEPWDEDKLNDHNKNFEATDPIYERIAQFYEWEDPYRSEKEITATSVCIEIGILNPTRLDTAAAGRALRKLSGKPGRLRGYKLAAKR